MHNDEKKSPVRRGHGPGSVVEKPKNFKESIIIDKLIIESDDDKYIIKTNDLDIICSNLNISFKPLKMLEKHSKLLDSILFSN